MWAFIATIVCACLCPFIFSSDDTTAIVAIDILVLNCIILYMILVAIPEKDRASHNIKKTTNLTLQTVIGPLIAIFITYDDGEVVAYFHEKSGVIVQEKNMTEAIKQLHAQLRAILDVEAAQKLEENEKKNKN